MAFLLLLFLLLRLRAAAAVDDVPPSRCAAATFQPPTVPGAEVLSIEAEERRDVATAPFFMFPGVSGFDICDVKVYLTHPGTEDKVLVQTWLPLDQESWNGRYQATGGGAWATGFFDPFLGPAAKTGYAASATDGGHEGLDASWALKPDRSIDWNLLQNFASRSLADQVYVGKSITEQFYGRAPHHSYWNGCSQGGRQGYEIAQKYPGLLDGIHAAAPAMDFVNMQMGLFWPQVAMKEAGTWLSQCEYSYFMSRAIEECDILDGVRDGILEDPELCTFEPGKLVGDKIECNGEVVEITPAMADVVQKYWQGPTSPFGSRLWHGFPIGTTSDMAANITIDAQGLRSSNPHFVASSTIRHLLIKDPSFNISKLSYTDYLGNYNLQAFKEAGGKLLTWHGTNDNVIPYQNTVQYRKRVEANMGGPKAVNEFYRLFIAPGVEHCGLGAGPVPNDPLQALVDWVEKGEPPERLEAETENAKGERITRELCPYPKKSKYMGIGDGFRASSWACEGGEEEEEEKVEGKADFLGGLKDRLVQVGVGLGLSIG
ncbi:feruloyl esterase B precursor [Westerdykella ornata]|uniref:Carboxylic ester hydrolase n=1 Tax=Westerdykella ornata TaxID=318751 RepID=A0A6A6JR27_WESOR|nr:feruloyl esterase B precursor [Westerdykella ornata]KAF2279100.1 feruloyl esterase B precursor [Westerdykella ornata]